MPTSRPAQPSGRDAAAPANPEASGRHGLPSVQAGPLGIEPHLSPSAWHPPLAVGTWHAPLLLPPRYSEAELAQGAGEIRLLREVYGNVLNASAKLAYATFSEHRWSFRSEQYLDDRAAFFGSTAAFLTDAEAARAELDADDEKLRKKIDPAQQSRGVKPRWREAQVVFYAWTRRAYEKKLGSNVNVPALINAGMSRTLEAALRQVRIDYGKGFNPQGFNPRPIKATKGYRLGTLSDHALGTAVDIRPNTNAQIESSDWQHLLALTGKSLDRTTRQAQWSSSPRDLHQGILDISDEFVKRLRAAVAVAVAQGQAEDAALAAAVKATPQLAKLGVTFVKRWQNGFFDLPWELLKELHEEKFVWGATFNRLDLHHFELPEKHGKP